MARNLGAAAGMHLVVRLAGLAVVVVLARVLTEADFGRYSVALALASLFTLFVESGMGGYLVREGTRSPERAAVALGHVMGLQVVTGIVAVGLCVLTAVILGYDSETLEATLFLAIGTVALIVQRSFLAILMSLDRARSFATFQGAQALLTAAATLGAVLVGAGPAGIAGAFMATALLSFPAAVLLLYRHWNHRVRFEREGLWETLVVAAAYSATKLGSMVLTYIDAVMVQAYKGNVAAAQYGASYRLLLALQMFPQVYADGLAQPAARLARDDRRGLEEFLNRAVAQLYLIGLPIGVGGFLLSERIMVAVFGGPYAPAATAAALLFLTLPIMFAGNPCLIFGLAMGLEKPIARAFGITVIVNVATNVVAIPAYGPAGAAAAMLLSTVVLNAMVLRLLWSEGIRFAGGVKLLKITAAGAALALTVLLTSALPLATVVLLAAAIYFGAIRVLRTLDQADMAMMPMGRRLKWLAAG